MPKAKKNSDGAPGGARFEELTPREIVARLSEYIVGQDAAKRSVAVAIRNRLRRLRVSAALRDEIIPKNLILIGPTGVGKTEIARRMATLLSAPFIKIEATKFTEVGYVGRDVDSIIRELAETSVRLVRQERMDALQGTLLGRVVDRLVDYMQPLPTRTQRRRNADEDDEAARKAQQEEERFEQLKRIREKLRVKLRGDAMDNETVTIEAQERGQKVMQVFTSQGMEEMGMDLQNLFDTVGGDKHPRKKRTTIGDAKRLLLSEEADRAIDMDAVVREAIERVELAGIVFIDEIDKIAHREGQGAHGPDVSREGVQRDILPLVEGTTIITKYGPVRTHRVLFVAAGAFHVSKVSDLIPEFQGRFPLRVELTSLSEADFGRILREPKNSLLKQYAALLATEGVRLEFTQEGIDAMARIATQVNGQAENIGARRLHTVLEKVLEEVSFDAPYPPEDVVAEEDTDKADTATGKKTGAGGKAGADAAPADKAAEAATKPAVWDVRDVSDDETAQLTRTVVIDGEYVSSRLAELLKDKDVSGYIL